MKKIGKAFLYILIAVILLAVIGIAYITLALPDVGKPENIAIVATPQLIARGNYLANHVVGCMDCHSHRDFSRFAGPVLDGKPGEGGDVFDKKADFPGTVQVPNITPYNLKTWTDGEIFRAITCGVRKDGSAIFPLMPWPYYAKMSREDIYAVIAYLRTLKPIEANYPKSKLDFPLNIIVHTMPQKATLGTLPNPADTLKYGAYLVNATACMDCHTQVDNGKIIPGLEYAGGRVFRMGANAISSANITPDKATGIGNWTSEAFVSRFKAFNDPAKSTSVKPDEPQTIMPWYTYGGLSEGDLKAMFAYLKTIKPIKNKVVTFRANSYTGSGASF